MITQDKLNQMTHAEKDDMILALLGRLQSLDCPPIVEWKHDVFLSYTHHDACISHRKAKFVALLKERVKTLYNHDLKIFDDEQLQSGEIWNSALEQAIDGSKILISMISGHYLKSPFCRDELWRFLGHLSAEPGQKRVFIPILWNHEGIFQGRENDELYKILRTFHWTFESLDKQGIEQRKHLSNAPLPKEIDNEVKTLAERIFHILGDTSRISNTRKNL